MSVVQAALELRSDREDLECPICFLPFLDPVAVPCPSTESSARRHVFCRSCLSQAWVGLPRQLRRCPLCRCSSAKLVEELIEVPGLGDLARRLDPALHEERLRTQNEVERTSGRRQAVALVTMLRAIPLVFSWFRRVDPVPRRTGVSGWLLEVRSSLTWALLGWCCMPLIFWCFRAAEEQRMEQRAAIISLADDPDALWWQALDCVPSF
mmetsp:Transcript_50679/g.135047  ORF Transcript_50679/g.135047 Transcript_50679/m.135047 type:complete len:209 (-) Transcript_50679:257-883(-)